MSLYSQYIKERTGDEILENEQGFMTYRLLNSGISLYAVDVFVLPEFRKSGVAKSFFEQLLVIGKEAGCSEILGSVVPSANGSTNSLKFLLSLGMSLKSSSENFIIFKKDLV